MLLQQGLDSVAHFNTVQGALALDAGVKRGRNVYGEARQVFFRGRFGRGCALLYPFIGVGGFSFSRLAAKCYFLSHGVLTPLIHLQGR